MSLSQGLHLFGTGALLFQLALLAFELSEGQSQQALGRLLMGILLLSAALLLRQLRFAAPEAQALSQVLHSARQRWRWFWPAALMGVLALLAEGVWWIWQALAASDSLRLWDLLSWVLLGSSLLLRQLEALRP